ncbi:PREDICTED: uncharacterized protein LOC105557189 [Vollenhovia emeryi]|uniref:uncharacterized protein LOC105557189 n=1 Tax=Vollenhovia emeryi TaxID=411798 RepID=UPI0005F47A7D|nr:PREDICTED: uncharacterized protein LOC105557189 [Vollenhovia emeryi]XP_011859759.1 PREDICTED: uncharacterized protein LOC105557189 [Vollenhovia emeryi]
MKFRREMFICPLIIASAIAMMQITRTTLESCNPNEWVMTNTTLKMGNNTKMITCDITYKEAGDPVIYTIHIVIDGCNNRTVCTGKPIIWLEDINCDAKNLTELDMNACKVADEFGNFEEQKEWLKFRYGLVDDDLYKLVFCIHVDNIDFSNKYFVK